MTKKNILIILFFAVLLLGLSAEQITKFAVIDTSRIFDTFRRDSKAARDYQEKVSRYKMQADELVKELKELQQKKVNAIARGEDDLAKEYAAKVKDKTAFILEFKKACNDELKSLRKDLMNDDEFYQMLYAAIEKIAEREGYSMVMVRQEISGIIWYSPTVDITEKVIQELQK